MTRDEMVKRKWKAYERIFVENGRSGEVAEMMLLSIDFDFEQLKLVPFDPDGMYENNEVFISIKFCSIPQNGMLIIGGKAFKKGK